MEKISPHISYQEAIRSNTALRKKINNTPDQDQLKNMKALALNLFEPLRAWAKSPIFVSSFFRCPLLNVAVGGAYASDHMAFNERAAIDIDGDVFEGKSNKELFEFIRDNLEFDKLIWEFGSHENPNWVHASYSCHENRKIVLKAITTAKGTEYIRLWDS